MPILLFLHQSQIHKDSIPIPLEEGAKSTGVVLLDQLVTIDYNARQWSYVETVDNGFLDKLLKTTLVVFQKNQRMI